MFDSYNRAITYLRISVTDRCNLRCRYCMPEEGVPIRPREDFLTLEQMAAAARAAVGMGVTKVRLTGGEPLVKRGIVELVQMIAAVPGLEHLAMTTNGTLLAPLARALREAGLQSINISLDSLDPVRYGMLTRGGDIAQVLAGLEAALGEGLPVKVNMVVLADTAEVEIGAMREFCASRGARLQLIRHYELGRRAHDQGAYDQGAYDQGAYDQGAYDRPPSCDRCNRIRLTADGMLKPCLHSDQEVKLDFSRLEESLREAVLGKPRRGSACTNRAMPQIGG